MRCDIFCKVIDNYGDIGVCWRLARQLASEHAQEVRLWVDDLASFRHLEPQLNDGLTEQTLAGVCIRRWDEHTENSEPADIVIEAFACDPPETYVQAMAAKFRKPVWFNLEYLTAEAWVEGSHAMPSPHPRLALVKYFFFPGFTTRTGGLLREAPLIEKLTAFQNDEATQKAFWQKLGAPLPQADALKISLFAYENQGISELLDAWTQSPCEIFCAVTDSRIAPEVREWARRKPDHGKLSLAFLPFLPQDDYDLLLAACDLNFVRGEDSFVRAQWAAIPFVWHIYRQEESAHIPKLEAFLDLYSKGLREAESSALRSFWLAWEASHSTAEAWPSLLESLPALKAHAGAWRKKLVAQGDLASKLLIFCRDLLQSGPL